MPMYRYFDLAIDSDVQLPLPRFDRTADIVIQTMPACDFDLPEGYWQATKSRASVEFLWEEAGRFIIENGSSITIHPKHGCSDGMLVDSLLGECLGTILIQRGMFCLHASAVNFDGIGLVFTGAQGSGKSTLAWLSSRLGAMVLTEEVVVVENGCYPSIIPGPAILKIRDEVIDAFGSANDHPKAFPESEKRLVTVAPVEQKVPMKHVLFLRPGTDLKLGPMSRSQAAFALMENTFAAHLTEGYQTRFVSSDAEAELFKRCGELAGYITPRSLTVPPKAPTVDDLKRVLAPLVSQNPDR